MDDFVISNLHESKNEWCSRLVSILTPLTIEGINSIFKEAVKMCEESNEISKYLMTFQNMLARIPKWNNTIIEDECKRIMETSGCHYLEDLVSCVHIIQLKVLTCIRVGNKQKKIDISIPKLNHFIHRVYINVARKVYSNIYLFEKKISDLQIQKNRRELEIIVQECILVAIRESIPTESIIKAYMDESIEDEEEVTIEPVIESEETPLDDSKKLEQEVIPAEELPKEDLPPVLSIENLDNEKVVTRLTFNDIDTVSDGTTIDAPKTIDRLEEISKESFEKRKTEEDKDDNEEDLGKIIIQSENAILDDVFDLDDNSKTDEQISLDDIEDI